MIILNLDSVKLTLYALKQDKELAEESANTLDESNISNQLFLTLLNPEPLLAKVLLTISSSSWPLTFPPDNVIRYFFLQMLPTSAYWPKFLGACGRLAVFEVLTPKINHKCARFASRIWESRWKIMPRLLGEKEQNFLFIWSGLIKILRRVCTVDTSGCRLAMLLTENELGLSFYLTDWAPENFAVTTDTMKVSSRFSPHRRKPRRAWILLARSLWLIWST